MRGPNPPRDARYFPRIFIPFSPSWHWHFPPGQGKIDALRHAFRPMIYLDHNATTPPLPEVVDAVARWQRDAFANPGSRHAAGRRARQVLEQARESLAALLGAFPDEVVFTSGGTESNNAALLGFCQGTPGTIALTPGEHPAVLETCRSLAARGYTLCELPVDAAGQLVDDGLLPDPAGGPPRLPPQTRLVAVLLAHNETGVLQSVGPLAHACLRQRVPLHLDALQAVGKIPVDFHALQAATLAVGAHKFGGPRGVGALLVRRGTRLAPTLFGGHQEEGRRPGTEPVPLIAGMALALELSLRDHATRIARLTRLRDLLEAGLRERCPPVVLNGSRDQRLPNTLNVAFPGVDGEALLVALDLAGIACSLGSTCASGSAEPAPILVAMGVPPEWLLSAVRFSLGPDTTDAEIHTAIERISRTVTALRSVQPASLSAAGSGPPRRGSHG